MNLGVRSLLAVVLAILSGCGPVFESRTFDPAVGEPGDAIACPQSIGGYFLPKSLLTFEVTATQATATDAKSFSLSTVEIKRVADGRQTYCLNFLGSALYSDAVSVKRENGLLAEISTSLDDETPEIVNALVDAAAAVASANLRSAKVGIKQVVAHYEVDPFDAEAIRKVTAELAQFDHCIYLDPVGDPNVPDWQGDLCRGTNGSRGQLRAAGTMSYSGIPAVLPDLPPASEGRRGILYKPVLTHRLVVMKRMHHGGGSAWQMVQTKRVLMTNAAPTFVIEFDRVPLVVSKMDVKFDAGVLTAVDIDRPSTADELASMILRTVQVAVSIPVRALVIGRTDAENREALIKAQAQQIDALKQLAAAQGRSGQRDVTSWNRFAQRGAQTQETMFDPSSFEGLVETCIRSMPSVGSDNLRAECEAIVANQGNQMDDGVE